MSHGACTFFRILRRFGHNVFFVSFLPLSCIVGFREKHTELISFANVSNKFSEARSL